MVGLEPTTFCMASSLGVRAQCRAVPRKRCLSKDFRRERCSVTERRGRLGDLTRLQIRLQTGSLERRREPGGLPLDR